MKEETITPKRIAVYIRVSTEDQAEKYGKDMQEESVMKMIESKAVSHEPMIFAGKEHIYFDDISGTTPLVERPAFARMMEAVTLAPEGKKPFDAVAVYKIDRFARKLNILLETIDFFDQYNMQFISVNESIDTSTPFGRAMLGIIGVIAELERDTILERTQGGRQQALKQGVHMGNAAPFGFDKDENKRLVVFEIEAKVVRMMFSMFVNARMSVYQIADWFKENEYVTPDESAIRYGKRKGKSKNKRSMYSWHPERVRKMLKDDIYRGIAYYNKTKNGKKVPKSEWYEQQVPQIIDELTFAKTQRLLKESKHQRKETRTKHTYLLSGLMRCDSCQEEGSLSHLVGQAQTVKSTGKKVYYYACKAKSRVYSDKLCKTIPVPADAIEDYVVSVCKNILANPVDTFKYQQELKSTKVEMKQLRGEEDRLLELVSGLPDRRERIREQHKVGLIDSSQLKKEFGEFLEKEKTLNKKLKEVRIKMSQNSLSKGYLDTFKLFNEKYQKMLTKVGKNRSDIYDLLHTMIDEIVVYSRPLKAGESVAGRKKKGQLIPYRLHIKLKLPQEMLNTFGHQEAVITEKVPKEGTSSGQKDIGGAR